MRPKHLPQRTCIGCRDVLSKRSLIRLVRSSDGVAVDPTGKKSGRGAYVHDRRSCWERALKGDSLERAFKTTLSDEERERLRAHGNSLPDEA